MADFLSWTPAEIVNRLGELTPQQALDWDFARRHESVPNSELFSYEQVLAASSQPFPWPKLPVLRERHGALPEVLIKPIAYEVAGTIIAGGFVSSSLMGELRFNQDVDYFITSDPVSTAINWGNKIVKKFGTYLSGYMMKGLISLKFYTPGSLRVSETQLILRKYQSTAAVIYGFDIGSSAIAYDGTAYHFTLLGLIAHAWYVNLIDPRRRSPTFEVRLAKYMERGFALGLVGFGGFESDDFMVQLPHMTLIVNAANPVSASGVIIGAKSGRSYTCSTEIHPNYKAVLRMWDPEVRWSVYFHKGKFEQWLLGETDFASEFKPYIKAPISRRNIIPYYRAIGIPNDKITLLFDAEKKMRSIRKVKADFSAPLAPYVQAAQARFAEFDWKVPASHWWIEGNPQEQFTGSIEPLPETPEEFWGERVTKSTWVVENIARPAPLAFSDCPFCLDSFMPGDSWVLLPCGHGGHAVSNEKCLGFDEWRKDKKTCPMCREVIAAKIADKVYGFKIPADFFETGLIL